MNHFSKCPMGLNDITDEEQRFAQDLVRILHRHGVPYQKIRRFRAGTTLTPEALLNAISPRLDRAIEAQLMPDLAPLAKRYQGSMVLGHSVMNMESGHYFLQHLPRGGYPAGGTGRVKRIVGVFDNGPSPWVSLVKISRESSNTERAMLEQEAEMLGALGQRFSSVTREQWQTGKTTRNYLHEICFTGQGIEDAYRHRDKNTSPAEFFENVLISGLANLALLRERRMLHLDIKDDNMIVDTKGNGILIDYSAAARTNENGQGKRVTYGRCPLFRRRAHIFPGLKRQKTELVTVTQHDDLLALALTIADIAGLYKLPGMYSPSAIYNARYQMRGYFGRPPRYPTNQLTNETKAILNHIFTYDEWNDQVIRTKNDPLPELLKLLSPSLQARFESEKKRVRELTTELPQEELRLIEAAEQEALNPPTAGTRTHQLSPIPEVLEREGLDTLSTPSNHDSGRSTGAYSHLVSPRANPDSPRYSGSYSAVSSEMGHAASSASHSSSPQPEPKRRSRLSGIANWFKGLWRSFTSLFSSSRRRRESQEERHAHLRDAPPTQMSKPRSGTKTYRHHRTHPDGTRPSQDQKKRPS